MKSFLQACLFAAAAAMFAGCSSQPKAYYHAGDEAPPPFLTGPAAALLTNMDGFSAKLAGSFSSANGFQRTLSGVLLGRQGLLIYQPDSKVKGKRAATEGGMFFIWNETGQSGYVLSDPLQAYAPTSTGVQPTNVTLNAIGAVQEAVNGHPCRKVEAVVQSSDGSSARFMVWQAQDAKLFPVRIQSPGAMTLNFSNLRLEMPAVELFKPPDGFTKYASPVALMNELIIRQTSLDKRNQAGAADLTPVDGANMNNWRPAMPQ